MRLNSACSFTWEGFLINSFDNYLEIFGTSRIRRGQNIDFYDNLHDFQELVSSTNTTIFQLAFYGPTKTITTEKGYIWCCATAAQKDYFICELTV